jgi:hypothetical protein
MVGLPARSVEARVPPPSFVNEKAGIGLETTGAGVSAFGAFLVSFVFVQATNNAQATPAANKKFFMFFLSTFRK